MVDFKQVILEAAKHAVSKAVEVQRDFINGKGEITYKAFDDAGAPIMPATIGDEQAQAIYTERFRAALGAENIYFKNEEDVSDAESRANAAREQTAKYRIAVDPIDGTGNYSGDKTPGKERKPVNRSVAELTEKELTSGGTVRPGWGSMVAIQERQADDSWKTIASGIYESNSADTPDNLKGKIYIAEKDKQGVSVINLQSGQEEGVILTTGKQQFPALVLEGGFSKVASAKAEPKKALQEYVKAQGNKTLGLSCVAQSALGVITGKAQGYFQGYLNLHDILPVTHLAEKAGLFVMALDKNDGKPAFEVVEGGKKAVEYPIFMAATPELAIGMAEKFIEAAGWNKDKLTFRNGEWEEKSFEQIKTDLLASEISQAPARADGQDWSTALGDRTGRKLG